MSKKPTRTLVIVESPAKCSKIEEMLGPAYVVRASYGHIRDIVDGLKAIDFTNQYAITYGMIDNELKRKKIAELKTLKLQCSDVLIASDPDREGEAIAYHVAIVLGLPIPSAKRIKFQEITKRAILNAVASPGIINMELVRSQEARRVLDLLVGFELSPILSRALGGNLSAGRCQSPAVRLVYDREKEIERQETTSSFTIDVVLTAETSQRVPINATFKKRYLVRPDVEQLFEMIQLPGTIFIIDSFTKKLVEHSPPKPYTTSTIQQDCSSLLSMNPKETMSILQKLYEAGKTTYMRTDSVILSRDAMDEIGLEIRNKYDASFHTPREYKNKGAASQEAHEAVRPTHMTEYPLQPSSNHKEEWSARESRVYELVWRRTMASQMTNQRIQRNSAEISMTVNSPKKIIYDDKLESVIEIEEFPGWKIVYGSKISINDDVANTPTTPTTTTTVEAIQSLLNCALICIRAEGTQSYARNLGRYTEASLIKDLESQGIGRPSTYANIMETIIKERKYVDVRDFPGIEKPTDTLLLTRKSAKSAKSATLTLEVKSGKTILGKEKNKLVISPLGYKIVEFLMKEFGTIMDYDFTKLVEEELDLIIEKKANYSSVVDKVYTTFHPHVLEMHKACNPNRQSDMVVLGTYDEHEVILKNGKFGYYLVYNGENFGIGYSTPERKQKIVDEHDIEEAVALIDSTTESRKKRETNPVIKVPPKGAFEIRLGPYGYYFAHNKKFYSIGKREPGSLTEKDCRDIMKDKYENK
jgi:DNA topoisomerase-1